MLRVSFTAPLERGQHGRGTFTWVSLDDESGDLLADLPLPRAGFGSLPCLATIGGTTWKTSVFPSEGTYLLLVARKVCKTEGLEVGKPCEVALELLGT